MEEGISRSQLGDWLAWHDGPCGFLSQSLAPYQTFAGVVHIFSPILGEVLQSFLQMFLLLLQNETYTHSSLSIKHFFLFWEIPNLLQKVWFTNIFLTSVCPSSLDWSPVGPQSVRQGGIITSIKIIIIIILNTRRTYQVQNQNPNFKRNDHQCLLLWFDFLCYKIGKEDNLNVQLKLFCTWHDFKS